MVFLQEPGCHRFGQRRRFRIIVRTHQRQFADFRQGFGNIAFGDYPQLHQQRRQRLIVSLCRQAAGAIDFGLTRLAFAHEAIGERLITIDERHFQRCSGGNGDGLGSQSECPLQFIKLASE